MKAKLILITKEMTGSTELAKALNKNFDSLNDIAAQREDAIFKGMKDMEARIIRSFNESIDIKLNARITPIEKKLNAIIKHLQIDPNLLLED